jgi:hypothetical protein
MDAGYGDVHVLTDIRRIKQVKQIPVQASAGF